MAEFLTTVKQAEKKKLFYYLSDKSTYVAFPIHIINSTYSYCNNQMAGNALDEEIAALISDESPCHRAQVYSSLNYGCVLFLMNLKIIHALEF